MKKLFRNLNVYLVFFTLTAINISIAEDFVYYELKKGEYISEVLNDLGTCPLYGSQGNLSDILKINTDVDPDNIKTGQQLKIPYSSLVYPDKILFFPGGKVLPKTGMNNLCSSFKKKTSKNKINVKPSEKVKSVPKAFDPPPPDMPMVSNLVVATGARRESLPYLESIHLRASENDLKNSRMYLEALFSSPVITKGRPKLRIQAKGNLGYAYYHNGDGSNKITFIYRYDYNIQKVDTFKITIPDNHLDFDISDFNENPIIVREKTHIIPSTFSDSGSPHIISISGPDKRTYQTGDTLHFFLEFNEDVHVEGKPLLPIYLDNNQTFAIFQESQGPKRLKFFYKVEKNDQATKGIEVLGKLKMDDAHIKDWRGNEIDNNFPNQFFRDVNIIQKSPKVVNIILPSQKIYRYNELLMFTLIFDEPIEVEGNPTLHIKIGENVKIAEYDTIYKNSVSFKYKITQDETDHDGITLLPRINFNEGKIYSKKGILAKEYFDFIEGNIIKVDSGKPQIVEVKTPREKTFRESEYFEFSVKFDKEVTINGTPFVEMLINDKKVVAEYTGLKNGNTLQFQYQIKKGDDGENINIMPPLHVRGGEIVDDSGNTINPQFQEVNLQNIFVDTQIPYITQINFPENVELSYGDNLQFIVSFNEPVFVSGKPLLRLLLKTGEVFAEFTGGHGSDKLVFTYIIHPVDKDLDGIEIHSPLKLYESEITDSVGNNAKLKFKSVQDTSITIDGTSLYKLSKSMGVQHNATMSNQSINNFPSNMSFKPFFSNIRIDAQDLEDGTIAHLTSALNGGGYFTWISSWSPLWQSELSLGMKIVKFEEATNFTIDKLINEYSRIQLGGRYFFLDKLSLLAKAGVEQRPYIHAQGTRRLVIDPLMILRFDAILRWNFWEFESLRFGTQLGYTFLGGKSNDNFDLESGSGYMLNIYTENAFRSSLFRIEFSAEFADQNSNISNQTNRELGLSLQYVIPFGEAPILF